METVERQEFGWRFIVAWLAFGREDAAIGIVNDVLDDIDRRKPSDCALAVDCLSALLLFLADEPAARHELPPYIAEFASLAPRIALQQEDTSLGLLARHLLNVEFDLPIDERSRRRLRNLAEALPAEPTDAMPVGFDESVTSLASLPEEIVAAVDLLTTVFEELGGDRPLCEASVVRSEAELRTLESAVSQFSDGSPVRLALEGVLANFNAWQLRALLHVGDADRAMKRAFRLFRFPRNTTAMADCIEGASLFLGLTRIRCSEEDLRSAAYYNSKPVQLIRKNFAESLLPGPLDNQLLPFLARNLDAIAPLASELLLLFARRPCTQESAVVLMIVLGELIFDRMAWKVQDLVRTKRRVTEETRVLVSEYEKVMFSRTGSSAWTGSGGRPLSVPHHRLRMRMSEYVDQPHRFAPRLILHELRSKIEPNECLITFRLDPNGLWMGLVGAARGAVAVKLCDYVPATEAMRAYSEDARTGAIVLWNEADFAWFGDVIVAPLESLLPPGVERLVVVGSQLDVPVHAAYLRGTGYAIERYCIMYEQSRRALAANRKGQHRAVTRLALIAYEGVGERRLRHLSEEVALITAATQSRLGRRRPSTSCRSARALLRDAGIDAVHMSGHMRTPGDVAGWRLGLNDGELDCLGALYPVAPQLRLVVLMACSAGAIMPGRASLEAGLPHVLVALGAGAVIAPRRPIDDGVAAAFSGYFYSSLAACADIPEAYRYSLVRVMKDHRPGAWSALVLHGR